MTDKQDEKKIKKLTLSGSKLSLGNKSIYPRRTGHSAASGSVVVEVKRGRAASSGLSLNKNPITSQSDKEQDERRLAALQKSKIDKVPQEQISTLSKLAEINQGSKISKPEKEETIEQKNISDSDQNLHSTKDQLVENQNKEDTQKETRSVTKLSNVTESNVTESNVTESNVKKDDFPKKEYTNLSTTIPTKEKTDEEKTPTTKPKNTEHKKLKKSDIINMLDEDSGNAPFKTRSLASIKRAREKEKRKNIKDVVKAEKLYREVILPEVITVSELSNKMTERASDVIRELMKLGVMANSSQSIDADTAELIITSFGHSVKRVKESDVENILIDTKHNPDDLKPRAPIVTVMGHVDHGKTSLLDALKETDIVSKESGGITQHIGAYSVTVSDNKMITFIDTPGHAAFTEMRTRGANVTDIVVLVVAADDGIKTQTVEAINHAKAAEVPIIVAINKIDKPDADADRVRNELLTHELIPEELGGDIMTVEVSAIKRQNLDKLEEAILLTAEMQELKANANNAASGAVVETRIDTAKGVIVTVIIQNGTLKKGDIIIAGQSYGRVKRICNDKGRTIAEAGPSVAVEVFGLNDLPRSGDILNVVQTDKQARDIINYRIRNSKKLQITASKSSLEDLFLKASGTTKTKELPLIIKGDTHGSIEAIISSLNKIESDEVNLKILHNAVGGITESDITLAKASGAIILGFNVRANNAASRDADDNKIDVRYYSIIYNVIDDIKAVMSGMLSPIIREVYIGSVDIRQVFNISKVGKIAGSYVTKGIIKRGAGVRLLRDNIVVHEGTLKTLKRFKDDVKEVREGFECGIAFEKYDDIKVGDTVEVFEIVEEKKKL